MLTLSRRCAGISIALAGALAVSGCAAGSPGPSSVDVSPGGSRPTSTPSTTPTAPPSSPGPEPTAPGTPSGTATTTPAPEPSSPGDDAPPPDDAGGSEGSSVVVPSIVYAGLADGRVVVNAFIPETVESSGTCVAEFTSGATARSTSGPASADATSTWCDPLSLPVSDLAPGTWTVTVRYSSTTTAGRSDRFEVVIP